MNTGILLGITTPATAGMLAGAVLFARNRGGALRNGQQPQVRRITFVDDSPQPNALADEATIVTPAETSTTLIDQMPPAPEILVEATVTAALATEETRRDDEAESARRKGQLTRATKVRRGKTPSEPEPIIGTDQQTSAILIAPHGEPLNAEGATTNGHMHVIEDTGIFGDEFIETNNDATAPTGTSHRRLPNVFAWVRRLLPSRKRAVTEPAPTLLDQLVDENAWAAIPTPSTNGSALEDTRLLETVQVEQHLDNTGGLTIAPEPETEPNVTQFQLVADISDLREKLATSEAARADAETKLAEGNASQHALAEENARLIAQVAELEAQPKSLLWWQRLDDQLQADDRRGRSALASSLGRVTSSWAIRYIYKALEEEDAPSVRARLLGALYRMKATKDLAPFEAAWRRSDVERAALKELFGDTPPWAK